MKKIISLFAALLIACNSLMIMAAPASQNLVYDLEYETALFEYLGAISSQNLDLNKSITRGEFVQLVYKAIGLPEVEYTKYFDDVTKDSDYYEAVSQLVEYGYVSLADDGCFNPDDNITYEQAVKILLVAAGYKEYAEAKGGYPAGYTRAAVSFGIGRGISEPNSLKMGEALSLMFDSLTMGFYSPELYGDDYKRYYVDEKTSVLYMYRKILVNQGVLEATDLFTSGESFADEKKAIIDGKAYTMNEGLSLNGFECEEIEFIYVEREDDNLVVAAKPVYDENKVSVKSKNIVSFDANTYTLKYYETEESEKVSTLSLNKSIKVLYNGVICKGPLSKIFDSFVNETQKGTVELKKSGSSSGYSVMVIKSYRRYIVDSIDYTNKILYNKFDVTDQIKIDSFEKLSVYNADGTRASYNDLAVFPTSVLIGEADNKKLLEIILPASDVSGSITSVNASERKVTYNNNTYIVDAVEWKRIENSISRNMKYRFVTDAMGELSYIGVSGQTEDMNIGYIADVIYKSDFNNEGFLFKIFCYDGEMKYLKFSDSVVIDGRKFSAGERVDAVYALPGTESASGITLAEAKKKPSSVKAERQAIRFTLNGKGDISYVDSSNVMTDYGEVYEDTLTRYKKRFELLEYMQSKAYKFDRDVLYSPTETKVICVPWSDTDGNMIEGTETWKSPDEVKLQKDPSGSPIKEEDYMYSVGYNFVDYHYYKIDAYNYNPENPYTDLIVVSDDFVGAGGSYGMVKSVDEGLNADGDVTKKITVIEENGENAYYLTRESGLESIDIGDIVSYTYHDTEMTSVEEIFDRKTRKFIGSNASVEYWYTGQRTDVSDTYRQNNNFSKGTVVEVNGQCIFWKYEMDDPSTRYDEAADTKYTKLAIYDVNAKGNPNVHIGTLDEVRYYNAAGDDASYIVFQNGLNRSKMTFIYNGGME